MPGSIKNVTAVIGYIESHLYEKLDLQTLAAAVHYSKYHLHRMFTDTVDLTVHDYIQRRRLTEAAKLLVFSDMPILEIALNAGYESRQAFSDIFKAMYKKTPNRYREEKDFYPLQLSFVLNEARETAAESDWKEKIVFAEEADVPAWLKLVRLTIDGFPHLDEKQHREQLRRAIQSRRALILKDAGTAVGAMAFNETTGNIDFLAVHPQYPKGQIAKAFCEKPFELSHAEQISVTTFREGDKADTGYRELFKSLGFIEGELLFEFGYPTQRFTKDKPESKKHG